jgi:hypothetical protein
MFSSSKKPNNKTRNAKSVLATRLGYAGQANQASSLRSQASMVSAVAATTAATTAGVSVSMLATGAALGVTGLAVPPAIPVMIAVMVATSFIMRQKGMNEELRSNLFFIKMEVERMMRSTQVIQEIANARGIHLNTMSLSTVMKKLNDKIMLFADKQTAKDIKELEVYLQEGKLQMVQQVLEQVGQQAQNAVKADATAAVATAQKGGAWFSKMRWQPTGWSARWLSPDETLRQIIRDITIATVWYAIMLSEFNIFMQYMDIKNVPMPKEWVNNKPMEALLVANKQLSGPMNPKNAENTAKVEKYNFFYDPKSLQAAVTIATVASTPESKEAAAEASKEDKTPATTTPPAGQQPPAEYQKTNMSSMPLKTGYMPNKRPSINEDPSEIRHMAAAAARRRTRRNH